MTEMLLSLRPVIAVLISMAAAGLILVTGEKISANSREAITMTAAVLKAVCVYSMIPARAEAAKQASATITSS